MSGVKDWISNPQQYVESVYRARSQDTIYDWTSKCLQEMKSLLTKESISCLQYVNSMSLDTITPNTLMCFRGMPTSKLFTERYPTEVSAVDAEENVAKFPIFLQKSANIPAGYCLQDKIDLHKTSLRHLYGCESIIGQTKWVKEVTYPCDCSKYSKQVNLKSQNLCQCKNRINCCILNIYDDEDNQKIALNSSYDFIGIVETSNLETCSKKSSVAKAAFRTVTLHCVAFNKLQHINPYLPVSKPIGSIAKKLFSFKIFNDFKSFLRSVTLDDELLADYLLCFLLDKVGDNENRFCFNICGISSKEYSRFLLKSLKFILTLVKKIELTNEGLQQLGNKQATYDSFGRFHLDDLNLGQNCLLFIDDIEARKGILKGETLKGFGNLCDFIMYQQTSNRLTGPLCINQCSVLIVSNKHSQLANCFQIPFVQTKPMPTDFSSYYKSVTDVENIALLRTFITAAKNFKFFFHQQIIQNTYGNTDEYHDANIKLWKSLNLMSKTEEASIELWKKILKMEEERRVRLISS